MDELISVIVPVYKVEDYLENCVDSIIRQTYKNIEIILVDDGSPDSCPLICDRYEREDKRIKALHKRNGGLSDARNYGTDHCSGDLVIYVDSDDYVEPNMIEVLYHLIKINEADVAISCHDETIEGYCNALLDSSIIVGTGEEILYLMLRDFSWSAWGKLFTKRVIQNQRFEKGILYEDFEFIPRTMLKAKKAVMIRTPLYHYRIRNDSIMGNSKKGYSCCYLYIAEKNVQLLNLDNRSNSKRQNLISQLYIRIFRDICKQYSKEGIICNVDFVKETKKFVRKNFSSIIKNHYLPIKYKISFCTMIISVNSFGKAMKLAKRKLRLK